MTTTAYHSIPAKQLLTIILLVGVMLITGSCASTKVITEYDCADAVSINKDTTVWHFFWGLIQAKDIHPDCDKRFNHLNKVVAKTTPGQVILSFITLGMVLPQKISWCCSPYNPGPGTLGQPRQP